MVHQMSMGKTVCIPCEDGAVEAYVSEPSPAGTFPALILIEEIWGVNEHIKHVCDRFAQQGFVVIAPELLEGSGTLERLDPEVTSELRSDSEPARHDAQAKMREATSPNQTGEFGDLTIARLRACVDYAISHYCSNGSVGVVGFCFGGTYAFQLAIHDQRIKAVIPFYGKAPEPLESTISIAAPVLAFYGEEDTRLVAKLPALVQTMEKNDRDFSYMLYPHAGHAFFNDTNARAYNEDAARDAWEKTLVFLHTNLD